MDRIEIVGLAVRCHIGAGEQERRRRQKIVLDVTCLSPTAAAAAKDDLSLTVDYGELARRIVRAVRASRFSLIESLAEMVADLCLEHPRVRGAIVRVTKPGAVRGASGAAAEITRLEEDRTPAPAPENH